MQALLFNLKKIGILENDYVSKVDHFKMNIKAGNIRPKYLHIYGSPPEL